jgi:hypothetical protein
MTLQEEVNELLEVELMIQNPLFQKYFSKPMKEERDKLRTAFFSDSLKESWRKGGKQEGIQLWMTLVENVHIDLNNKKQELKDSERGQ